MIIAHNVKAGLGYDYYGDGVALRSTIEIITMIPYAKKCGKNGLFIISLTAH